MICRHSMKKVKTMKKTMIGVLVIAGIVGIIVVETKRMSESGNTIICHVGGTMKPVMAELAKRFEAETQIDVEINSAGSGELLAHIDMHRHGDVYVCHDPFLDILMQKFKMGVDGWVVAELTPVIVVHKGNPKKINGIRDLVPEDVQLVLTDYEYSSLGHMLSTIFKKAGIDFDRFNKDKKIYTNRSGGYAANFVMLGNADAAIVWNAVAHLRSDKLDAVRIDEHLPIPYVDTITSPTGKLYPLTPMRVTAATLTCSRNPQKAKAFLDYIASEEAGEVFAEFGFTMSGKEKLYENGKELVPSRKGPIEVSATKDKPEGNEKAVKLYAGAGLRKAIDKLAAAFGEETGIVVEPEYGGSGIILTQVQMNKDGDLFMPGDVSWVEILQEKTGRVESMTQVSYFVPVIIVDKGNPKNITSVEDFYREDVSAALGREEACQVGKISTAILANYGLDRSELKHKESLTVNEIGVWVKMNDVDAGIVWDAIAANIADTVDIIDIPKDKNIISRVVVGLLSDSKNKEAAQKFIDFLTGKRGKKILNDNGFQTGISQE